MTNSAGTTVGIYTDTFGIACARTSFGPSARLFEGNGAPVAAVRGDFNGDGRPDVATANRNTGTVSVHLGDGVGSFGTATSFTTGAATQPVSVAAADFNGDGRLDLAAANFTTGGIVTLLGDGSGGFGIPSAIATGASPMFVLAGDFNGDGRADLAVSNNGAGIVSFLYGNGSGGFSGPANIGLGPGGSRKVWSPATSTRTDDSTSSWPTSSERSGCSSATARDRSA